MERFNADPQTDGIILIGEVGGSSEETAAAYLADIEDSKPVVAYIAGQSVPVGRRIGHAGTIMHYGTGTAESKMNALACAGATIARSPVQIGEQMASLIDNSL